MSEVIPIFPLGLVVFPGERLNLHIFEPRYKQLINDSVEAGTAFGIAPYIEGNVGLVGTEVEILSIHRIYADGEMDISVKGNKIFQVKKILPEYNEKLYAAAEINWVKEDNETDLHLVNEIIKLMQQLHGLLNITKDKIPEAASLKSFLIGHYIGLSLEQEFDLLCKRKEQERLKYIYTHLIKILPVVKETEALRQRIKANGHFKNIQPPEF
jgi:ATP-dependent Lon protease